jgi:benzaldehyde dehydrogenase (NAD)
VIEPATFETIGQVSIADPSDVGWAARLAVDAQRKWAAASYETRATVLQRASDLFTRHAEEIGSWLVRESGAVVAFGHQQTAYAASVCHEAAGLASLPHGELLRSSRPHLSFARRMPVGVVGVISPFNVPLVLSIRSLAPALALGNAVLLKPDPRTAVSGGVVLARIFEEAGLPPGLLAVLPGGSPSVMASPGPDQTCRRDETPRPAFGRSVEHRMRHSGAAGVQDYRITGNPMRPGSAPLR